MNINLKEERKKDCYCETCNKYFHHLGIARHRAMHRERKENCVISYSDYSTVFHKFKKEEEDERYKKNLKNLANQICNAHFGIKPTNNTLQTVEEKGNRIIL